MASDGNSQRTIQEVREYLLERLNSALRRPGMFGGEFALLLFMDAVAFAEGRDRAWRQEHERLRTRGGSGALGVSGMIQQVLGDGFGDARDPMAAVDAQLTSVDAQPAMASVYAEIAHRLRGTAG